MKFNPTFLEILVFLLVCLVIFIWTTHGRKFRRWLRDYFQQRRGPRYLKAKSPEDCPLCNRHICMLPHRPKPAVVPWSRRKSRRGRPKSVDTSGHACLNLSCAYFAIAAPAPSLTRLFMPWSAMVVAANRGFATSSVKPVAVVGPVIMPLRYTG